MNRRKFFKTSLAGAAVASMTSPLAALTSCTSAPKVKTPSVPLKLSFQEGIAPGKSLAEKLDYMEKLGIVGFEPGGGNLAKRVNEISQALNGRNIKVSAICAGFSGFILAEDPAVKAQFDSTMRDIVAAAGQLGSTGVIMVPAFNGQKPCLPTTAKRATTFANNFTSWVSTLSSVARPLSLSPSIVANASISVLLPMLLLSAATPTATA